MLAVRGISCIFYIYPVRSNLKQFCHLVEVLRLGINLGFFFFFLLFPEESFWYLFFPKKRWQSSSESLPSEYVTPSCSTVRCNQKALVCPTAAFNNCPQEVGRSQPWLTAPSAWLDAMFLYRGMGYLLSPFSSECAITECWYIFCSSLLQNLKLNQIYLCLPDLDAPLCSVCWVI